MCDVSITFEHRDVHAPMTLPSNSMVENLIIDGRINRILVIVMPWYVKFWTLLPCCTRPFKGLLRAFPACCTIHVIIESPSTIEFSLYLTIGHRDVDVEPPSHISILEALFLISKAMCIEWKNFFLPLFDFCSKNKSNFRFRPTRLSLNVRPGNGPSPIFGRSRGRGRRGRGGQQQHGEQQLESDIAESLRQRRLQNDGRSRSNARRFDHALPSASECQVYYVSGLTKQ